MRKTLGQFKDVGISIDILPITRTVNEMDVHMRARIGRKKYIRTISIPVRDCFETDLSKTMDSACKDLMNLIKTESPELFDRK